MTIMQTRRIAGIIALCMISIATYAQHITSREAMERAIKYLNDNNLSSHRASMAAPAEFKETKVDAQSIYAFNMDGGGYVIASADERILPILGYSDKGSIDWKSLPQNMKAWLKSYDDAIATLGDRMDFKDGNPLAAGQANAPKLPSRAQKQAIEPLIKTKWYQEEPYWNNNPLYAGENQEWLGQQCLTGCVATTMAQIMNYYQWPKSSTKGIPSYDIMPSQDSINIVWHIDSLPPVTFDWDNMLDNYVETNPRTYRQTVIGSMAQQEAVATLMRYCSQSVRMDFGPQASGANDALIVQALFSYFDYAPTVYYANRFSYGIDEWETLIYNEIADGRPVAYSGFSGPHSGHSFICDGYDGKGLFHINWGYGGMYDGFFSLSVLSPYAVWVGFCIQQCAVLGIQPPSPDINQAMPLYHARLSDYNIIADRNTVYFFYSFSSAVYQDASLENIYQYVGHDYAMGTIEPDGTLTPRFIGDPSDSIVYSNNWMTVIIDSTAIAKGKSMVLYPMVRFRNIPDSDWQILAGPQHCIRAHRHTDGSFKLSLAGIPAIEIKGHRITPNTGNANQESYLTLTIHNLSVNEYTGNITLLPLYYGDISPKDITNETPYIMGKELWYSAAFIRSDDEADVTITIKPEHKGTIRLWFYSEAWGYYYYYDIETDIEPDGVDNVTYDSQPELYHDLNGRSINGTPVRKGVYIRGKEKVLIE